ncbi:MAG: hypothetical protein M1378_00280 [Bacteroidetes bacterium]|nr:hypothetical protein [Bacteroidota bacterium]
MNKDINKPAEAQEELRKLNEKLVPQLKAGDNCVIILDDKAAYDVVVSERREGHYLASRDVMYADFEGHLHFRMRLSQLHTFGARIYRRFVG